MIIKDIETIKANQEELKRCNQILEDNWIDSSADQFKTTYLGPIEAAGTTFVAETFVHGQELRHHLQELEELKCKLSKLKEELYEICHHPSWEGCGIGMVEGHDSLNPSCHCQEYFVLTKDEVPYLNDKEVMARLASLRVTNLDDMENAHFITPVV
jgi:hypothetical protein